MQVFKQPRAVKLQIVVTIAVIFSLGLEVKFALPALTQVTAIVCIGAVRLSEEDVGGVLHRIRLILLYLKFEFHGGYGLQDTADGFGGIVLEDLFEVVEDVVVGGRRITHYKVDGAELGYLGNGTFIYLIVESGNKVISVD